jgi:NTP pyrophosphatase (non-canonical NTP hydrolase)
MMASYSKMEMMTTLVWEWGERCFGLPHMESRLERAQRMVEEAIEVCQALDVPKQDILTIADYVYSRPKGKIVQELGGLMVTTSVLCQTCNVDIEDVFMLELRRVLAKDASHFAKRNKEKQDLLKPLVSA